MGPFYEFVDFIGMYLEISKASDPTRSIKLMRNFGDAGEKIGQKFCRPIQIPFLQKRLPFAEKIN
jgi:hypothetical protein